MRRRVLFGPVISYPVLLALLVSSFGISSAPDSTPARAVERPLLAKRNTESNDLRSPYATAEQLPASTSLPSAPPSAGGFVWHWNIWGHSGSETAPINANALPTVKFLIAGSNPKPLSISLNEVCSTAQGNDLIDYLHNVQGYGYVSTYGRYIDPECGWFGNIVLVRTGWTGFEFARGRFSMDGVRRTWACYNSDGFVDGAFCTTHMSTNPDARASNLIEYRNVMQFLGALAGSGDFNALPNEGNLNTYWFYGYVEASGGPPTDSAYTYRSRADLTVRRRLDYIWLNDFFFDPQERRITEIFDVSDHFIYQSFI